MKKTSHVFAATVGLMISWGLFVSMVMLGLTGLAKASIIIDGYPFFLIVSFAMSCIFICIVVDIASDLRKQLPDDWAAKINQDVAMAAYGNPIPADAVDRRWLNEILEAANNMPWWFQHTQHMDPVQLAKYESEMQYKRQRIIDLINAAKNARGVRLPPVVTARAD